MNVYRILGYARGSEFVQRQGVWLSLNIEVPGNSASSLHLLPEMMPKY